MCHIENLLQHFIQEIRPLYKVEDDAKYLQTMCHIQWIYVRQEQQAWKNILNTYKISQSAENNASWNFCKWSSENRNKKKEDGQETVKERKNVSHRHCWTKFNFISHYIFSFCCLNENSIEIRSNVMNAYAAKIG